MATWVDITSACDECANELSGNRVRPMISCSHFSLSDSMSAVEVSVQTEETNVHGLKRLSENLLLTNPTEQIMDPKMDQCCGLRMIGTNRSSLFSFQLPSDVSSSHVALVIQRMIAGLVGFLNGSSLLDSSLKCVLLWSEGMASVKELDSPWGRLLHASSISIAQCIGHIYEAVLLADIYEDDDFCPSFKSFVADCSQSAEDLPKIWDDIAAHIADFHDLRELISFQRSVLTLFQELHAFLHSTIMSLRAEKLDSNNSQDGSSNNTSKGKSKSNSGSENTSDQPASAARASALVQLQRACEAVVSQALSLAELPVATSQGSLESLVFRGELGSLHQVGPVKNDPELPFEECALVLSSIARQVVQTIDAMQTLQSTPDLSFDHLLAFCGQLSAGRKMHLMTRSLLIVHLQDIAGTNMASLLLRSMDLRGIPALIGSNHATSRDWVSGSVSLAAWEFLKTFAISRNRLFHRMENLLSLWGNVATEALILDEELQRSLAAAASGKQHWFASWATLYVTAAMDLYFQVLSEMRILELHELDYFYWYWDYVSSAHCHSLEKLRSMRYELDVALYESEKSASKGKKAVPPAIPRPLPLRSEDLVFMGRGQICKGMFRLLVLLKQCGTISAVIHPYTSCSEVFSRRFRAFQSIVNPTPLSHQDFLDMLRQNSGEGSASIDKQALLSSASVCFQNAKKCFEEARKARCWNDWQEQQVSAIVGETSPSKEAVTLIKVAIANSLVLSKLKSILGENGSTGAAPGRATVSYSGYHSHFPVAVSAT